MGRPTCRAGVSDRWEPAAIGLEPELQFLMRSPIGSKQEDSGLRGGVFRVVGCSASRRITHDPEVRRARNPRAASSMVGQPVGMTPSSRFDASRRLFLQTSSMGSARPGSRR